MQPTEVYPTSSEPSSAHISARRKAVHNKSTRVLGRTRIEVPLDILISLLRPDELEKLQKYIASYLERH